MALLKFFKKFRGTFVLLSLLAPGGAVPAGDLPT